VLVTVPCCAVPSSRPGSSSSPPRHGDGRLHGEAGLEKMSGFIQMPDGHPGALGSATAEKAQANYTAAPVIACACRSLRVHAPARGSPPRERASRALAAPVPAGWRARERCCGARVPCQCGRVCTGAVCAPRGSGQRIPPPQRIGASRPLTCGLSLA